MKLSVASFESENEYYDNVDNLPTKKQIIFPSTTKFVENFTIGGWENRVCNVKILGYFDPLAFVAKFSEKRDLNNNTAIPLEWGKIGGVIHNTNRPKPIYNIDGDEITTFLAIIANNKITTSVLENVSGQGTVTTNASYFLVPMNNVFFNEIITQKYILSADLDDAQTAKAIDSLKTYASNRLSLLKEQTAKEFSQRRRQTNYEHYKSLGKYSEEQIQNMLDKIDALENEEVLESKTANKTKTNTKVSTSTEK